MKAMILDKRVQSSSVVGHWLLALDDSKYIPIAFTGLGYIVNIAMEEYPY